MRWAELALVVAIAGWGSSESPAQERLRASRLDQIQRGRTPERPDRTLVTLHQLNTFVPQVNFEEKPLGDVLDWFRDHGVKNIVVHWGKIAELADIDPATPVSLRLLNQTLGEILDLVLEQASHLAYQNEGRLFYRIINGVIEVSTRAHYSQEIVVRTYVVEDLLQTLLFHDDAPTVSVAGSGRSGGGGGEGGRGGRGGGGGVGGGNQGAGGGGVGGDGGNGIFEGGGEGDLIDHEALREEQIERLIEVIKKIRPDTWAALGKGTISEFRGKLVIAQTIEMHELIGGKFMLGAGKTS